LRRRGLNVIDMQFKPETSLDQVGCANRRADIWVWRATPSPLRESGLTIAVFKIGAAIQAPAPPSPAMNVRQFA
jgi:hypothetical protein